MGHQQHWWRSLVGQAVAHGPVELETWAKAPDSGRQVLVAEDLGAGHLAEVKGVRQALFLLLWEREADPGREALDVEDLGVGHLAEVTGGGVGTAPAANPRSSSPL